MERNYLSIPKLQRCNRWVWWWMNNFIPHVTGHVISYPCEDYTMLLRETLAVSGDLWETIDGRRNMKGNLYEIAVSMVATDGLTLLHICRHIHLEGQQLIACPNRNDIWSVKQDNDHNQLGNTFQCYFAFGDWRQFQHYMVTCHSWQLCKYTGLLNGLSLLQDNCVINNQNLDFKLKTYICPISFNSQS